MGLEWLTCCDTAGGRWFSSSSVLVSFLATKRLLLGLSSGSLLLQLQAFVLVGRITMVNNVNACGASSHSVYSSSFLYHCNQPSSAWNRSFSAATGTNVIGNVPPEVHTLKSFMISIVIHLVDCRLQMPAIKAAYDGINASRHRHAPCRE